MILAAELLGAPDEVVATISNVVTLLVGVGVTGMISARARRRFASIARIVAGALDPGAKSTGALVREQLGNGGSAMPDRLSRIEDGLAEIGKDVHHLQEDLADHRESRTKLEGLISQLRADMGRLYTDVAVFRMQR